MHDILRQVQKRVEAGGLSLKDAAEQIGVTVASLERHFRGAYVRSDSLAKYRAWLNGRILTSRQDARLFPDPEPTPPSSEDAPLSRLELVVFSRQDPRPYNVVDLFSGSGGMSLGFDLLPSEVVEIGREKKGMQSRENEVFRTILALDIEEKVVQLQNENHPSSPTFAGRPGRWVDVSDFVNEAEVLAFYFDHFLRGTEDKALASALAHLPRLALEEFKSLIRSLDTCFLATLHRLRSGAKFRQLYGCVDSTVFGQTSVIGFHESLGLPLTGTGLPTLGPQVWADHDIDPTKTTSRPDLGTLSGFEEARRSAAKRLDVLWADEVAGLQKRTAGKGKGQLASSAGRIQRFLDFLAAEPMRQVKAAWIEWRSQRDALRSLMFDTATATALRAVYQGSRRVDVLLGGPPCQGFSRIGRGKIRSLREHHVHVETDPEAGDLRNLLLC